MPLGAKCALACRCPWWRRWWARPREDWGRLRTLWRDWEKGGALGASLRRRHRRRRRRRRRQRRRRRHRCCRCDRGCDLRAPRGTTGVRRGGGGSRAEDSAKPAPPLPLSMAGPTGSRRTQVGSGVTIVLPPVAALEARVAKAVPRSARHKGLLSLLESSRRASARGPAGASAEAGAAAGAVPRPHRPIHVHCGTARLPRSAENRESKTVVKIRSKPRCAAWACASLTPPLPLTL